MQLKQQKSKGDIT